MTAPTSGPTTAQTRSIAERDRVGDVRGREALGVVTWIGPAMTAVLVLFTIYDVAANPAEQRTWRLLADVPPVLVIAAIVLAQRRGRVTVANAGWFVTLGSLAVSSTTLATVVLGHQTAMAVNLIIMVVVDGALALSTVQYVLAQSVALGGAIASVVLVAGIAPSSSVGDWLVVVVIAVAASLAIHLARERGFREMARILELLEQQAVEDPLTGLGTRRALQQMFSVVRSSAEIAELLVVLVFLDVDGLKEVNDAAGHDTGDRVLLAVAQAIRESARSRDVLARWGGDEFVLLGIGDRDAASRLEVSLVQRLAELNPAAEVWAGTASTGTATSLAADASLDDLVARADEELYRRRRSRGADGGGTTAGNVPAPRESLDVPIVTDG